MNQEKHNKLVKDFQSQYSNFNDWIFECDFHTGCFSYGKNNMTVYFTPEHYRKRQISIEFSTLEGEIVYSEDVPFPFHQNSLSAKQLFLVVFRYLTQIDKDPKIFGTFER